MLGSVLGNKDLNKIQRTYASFQQFNFYEIKTNHNDIYIKNHLRMIHINGSGKIEKPTRE
jgi:hypothetical protein